MQATLEPAVKQEAKTEIKAPAPAAMVKLAEEFSSLFRQYAKREFQLENFAPLAKVEALVQTRLTKEWSALANDKQVEEKFRDAYKAASNIRAFEDKLNHTYKDAREFTNEEFYKARDTKNQPILDRVHAIQPEDDNPPMKVVLLSTADARQLKELQEKKSLADSARNTAIDTIVDKQIDVKAHPELKPVANAINLTYHRTMNRKLMAEEDAKEKSPEPLVVAPPTPAKNAEKTTERK